MTCKDGIQLETFTKLSIKKANHKGLIESIISSKAEVVKKCKDFSFGTQYIISQFQANAHPNWDKWIYLMECHEHIWKFQPY